ncbi:MAG TPA: MDR family MFS transporter [Solirubrobacteraceae bacterium]|nr:MDR family MFS transporter [Solirubrobacteraceae bacterium]
MSVEQQPTATGMAASGGSHAEDAHAQRIRRLAFSAILLTTLLAALDQSIVSTALPRIVGDLGGFSDLSWVVSAYLLASTVTIPLYGKLSDLYGRRLLFAVAIAVFLIGSMLCGLAQTMSELIAFRAVQGLGAGGLIPLAQAAIGDLYSPRERGRYQGYVSSMWGIAAVTGPLAGGTLTEAISWRWIFYINLPLGVVALAVVMKTLGANRRGEHRIDYAGALTLGCSLGAILIACAWSGTTYPIGSAQVIGPFLAGLLGLGLFALIERRASEPIVPVALLRNRIFVTAGGGYFVVGALLFAVTIYIPVYLQDVRGNSPTVSGLTTMSYTIGWVVTAFVVGRLITRTGRYRIFPLVGTVFATAGVALLLLVGSSTGRVELCAMLVLSGCGMGLTVAPYLVGSQNAIAPQVIGAATAALNLVRAIGASLAVSILGAVLAGRARAVLQSRLGAHARTIDISRLINGGASPHHSAAIGDALLSGMHLVFLISTVVGLGGIAIAFTLEERPLSTQRQPSTSGPSRSRTDSIT